MAAPFDAARRFRMPAYAILTLSALLPFVELGLAISPVKPTQVMWRFGAVGLFSSSVAAPLFMLLLIYGVALLSDDRWVIYVVGTLAALAATLMFLSAGSFTLDALQMKRQVAPAALIKFAVASIQAFAKLLLEGAAATLLAVSAFRAARAIKRDVPKPTRGNTLVVAQTAKTKAVSDRPQTSALETKPNG